MLTPQPNQPTGHAARGERLIVSSDLAALGITAAHIFRAEFEGRLATYITSLGVRPEPAQVALYLDQILAAYVKTFPTRLAAPLKYLLQVEAELDDPQNGDQIICSLMTEISQLLFRHPELGPLHTATRRVAELKYRSQLVAKLVDSPAAGGA